MVENASYDATLQQYSFFIGLGLAILSTVFIGSSFIIKKMALIRIDKKGRLRAGAGGFGYLKEWMWWAGFLSMGVGEVANFAAYTFAPATLVTPLGALSILVSAVLASKFLHEKLNLLGKVGCLLCVLGSTIIVIHSPKVNEIETMDALLGNLENSPFLIYLLLVSITFCSISFYFGPRYGHRSVIVYVLICSSVGSLTVMACKGLGLAVKDAFAGNQTESEIAFALLFVFVVVVCVAIQMNYLNKALDLFNAGIVTPVYYVLFTVLVMAASAILFSEWNCLTENDAIGNVCGFSTVIVAVVLLTGFKDVEIGSSDLRNGPRHKPVENSVRIALKRPEDGEERLTEEIHGTRSHRNL